MKTKVRLVSFNTAVFGDDHISESLQDLYDDGYNIVTMSNSGQNGVSFVLEKIPAFNHGADEGDDEG